MTRPLALTTLVVAIVLAVAAPAGAASNGIPDATEPKAAAIIAVALGAITIVAAIVVLTLRPRASARS